MSTKTKIPREFPDDPVMEQLHELRRELTEELRGLTPQKKMIKIRQNVRAYLKKRGYALESGEDGTFKLVKTKD